MAISQLFKIQLENDIQKCEKQTAICGSEKLYSALVDRYQSQIENFMENLPAYRKTPTSPCGADYRPELRLIASKLRIHLLANKCNEIDNPLKAKVDEFIQRGVDIGRIEFRPAGNGFPFPYVAGPLYDAWMGEINIFNERYLKEHPLHDSIYTTYFHYRKKPSSHKEMMGHLRALSADIDFLWEFQINHK